MFSVGKRVEVSFDREDWRDTWFPATILEDIGNDSFLVEYHCEDAAPLRATVNFLHIRPCPPHLKDKNFVLLEKVDAYYHSGWWPGVITKALADCRYNVFFKHTKRDGEFSHTDLRPHMEWKDGKWFTSSQVRNLLSHGSEYGFCVVKGDMLFALLSFLLITLEVHCTCGLWRVSLILSRLQVVPIDLV